MYHASIYLLAFCIPLLKYGIQVPIILLVITWLFTKKELDKKKLLPILLFISVYLFHLIGMFYTDNVDRGMRDLVQKLSLILFPLLLGTGPKLTEKMRKGGMHFFIWGTLIAVISSFISSGIEYGATGNPAVFYMSNFSPAHHPSYISFYVVTALAMLLLKIEETQEKKRMVSIWLAVVFLSLSLVFPASKMGFLNWAMVFILFLAKWLFSKARLKKQAFILTGTGLLFLVFLKFDPVARARLEKAVAVTSELDQPKEESQVESNTARLYAWSTALDIITKTPFGVGTGDINQAMVSSFREQNLDYLADKSLNPHNEYLQLAVALGIPAALFFIFSLFYPFGIIIRTEDWIYGIFLLSVLAQFSVESMLEKQSGVIFFAFFNAFFFFSPKSSRWA